MASAMSFSKPSIRPSLASRSTGFSSVELLVATLLFGLAITATSGFFLASNNYMKMQARKVETNQAARATVDTIVRDLRLGGACLPVTGTFVSMDGTDNGDEDEIIVRTGLVRSDLSCVRTAVRSTADQDTTLVRVESVDGFRVGQRVYLRSPTNQGEYVTIATISPGGPSFRTQALLSHTYPIGSGVYVIDERRFYINHWDSPRGTLPELMMQIGDEEPLSYAVGIEKLDFQYQLRRNCPPCDVVDLPVDNDEWAIVEQVFVAVTARSERPVENGDYYRRTIRVGVKPRNLLPR